MTVYFVQGALGLARLATTFYLKDELGLGPAELGALLGITSLPWVIKPVYGFLSDSVPIFGYRRRSYLVLAGLIGTSAWLALGLLVHTAAQATVAILLTSLGVAISDVVVDSIVVARARDADSQAVSGALQSLCWGSSAVGGIMSAYASGAALEVVSPQTVFLVASSFPLLVAAISTVIAEEPVVRAADGDEGWEVVKDEVKGRVDDLWGAVSQRSVWLPATFMFCWQATPSSGSAFLYFMTNDLGFKVRDRPA